VDLLADALPVHIRHTAECPEVDPVLCATTTIPNHIHDQQIAWFRFDPTLQVGLGKGWQAAVQIPFDVRAVRVAYETVSETGSGEPYDPPYDDIHHRNEVVAGLVDGVVSLRRYAMVGPSVLGGGLGSTMPIGRTEADPFLLADQGLAHQHLQLGTGTFVPVLSGDLLISGRRWGSMVWGQARLPLYANAKGYQPPYTATIGGGPTFRVTPTLQVLANVEVTAESAELWHATPHGGRFAVLGGIGAQYTLSAQTVLQAGVRATAWQWTAKDGDEDATYVQPVIATVGISWSPKGMR
jgi:hypothetical protein